MHPIKEKLVRELHAILKQRINTAKQAIEDAKESKLNETKSTAGDKFETGRAMMQIEQEKNEMQLSKALLLDAQLQNLDLQQAKKQVAMGSLILTTGGSFFLSIGLGKIVLESQHYYCISSDAPISQSLIGSELHSTLIFNGKRIEILEIL